MGFAGDWWNWSNWSSGQDPQVQEEGGIDWSCQPVKSNRGCPAAQYLQAPRAGDHRCLHNSCAPPPSETQISATTFNFAALLPLTFATNADICCHHQQSSSLPLTNTAKSCHHRRRLPLSAANCRPIAFVAIHLLPCRLLLLDSSPDTERPWLSSLIFNHHLLCLLSCLTSSRGQVSCQVLFDTIFWLAQQSTEWPHCQSPSQCANKWEDGGWWPCQRNPWMWHDNLAQMGWEATVEEGILLLLGHGVGFLFGGGLIILMLMEKLSFWVSQFRFCYCWAWNPSWIDT